MRAEQGKATITNVSMYACTSLIGDDSVFVCVCVCVCEAGQQKAIE
jgi:hypothetical protein